MFRTLVLALGALAPVAAPAQDGRIWGYFRHVEPSPMETVLNLGYSVPQSDDVLASMRCVLDATGVHASVVMATEVQAGQDPVILDVSAPGYSARIVAQLAWFDDFVLGVEFPLALDDAFWTALMAGGGMTYGVPGYPSQILPLDGATDLAHAFLGDCLSIRELVPDAPAPIK